MSQVLQRIALGRGVGMDKLRTAGNTSWVDGEGSAQGFAAHQARKFQLGYS